MTYHLFGNILTNYGIAANNRGENQGNVTTLQRLAWKNSLRTTVSAEAIRWAIRYQWQFLGEDVNRKWDDDKNENYRVQEGVFDPEIYIDDDVLGYMDAKAATEDINNDGVPESSDTKPTAKGGKAKTKLKPGGSIARRGVLEVTRAISLTADTGDLFFGSTSGKKDRKSIHQTEAHATRYQYGFAMTPHRLKVANRVISVLDALASLGGVAGNHARFLYDFSPESIVLRWTHDFAPRILYCFEENRKGEISISDLVRRIEAGDIDPNEVWIGGAISVAPEVEELEQLGVKVFRGVKPAVRDLQSVILSDIDREAA
ncbi:MAG TPA: type I-B CRISPR-associated protein Cas7/Cst2/DevR [Microcoleaceae bacterium UBA11344]|jgi:CRISPR-associated autoregulator DevR family|nr:type I-B CRISPR-associated protein Cas7/Cst2/DevR [Microcoleaceae cyanobacterium UBA11344]